MSLKFCKDCTFFMPLSEMCNSEHSVKGLDPIWGRHENLTARDMRGDPDRCGLVAKFFVGIGEFKKFDEGGYIL